MLATSGGRLVTCQAAHGTGSVSFHLHPRSTRPPRVWPPEVLSLLHPPCGCGPRTAHDCPPFDAAHFLLSHHSHGHSARWSPGIFLEMQIGSCYSPARNCPSEKSTAPPAGSLRIRSFQLASSAPTSAVFPSCTVPFSQIQLPPVPPIACSLPAFNLKHACAGSSSFHSLPVAEKSLPPVTCLDL